METFTQTSKNIDLRTVDNLKKDLSRLKKLEVFGIQRILHGFYYISHYYPLRAMQTVDQNEIRRRFLDLESDQFEIYFHFPFCEQICGFCHFYKLIKGPDFNQKEDQIITAIIKELTMYKALLGQKIKTRSIQFGGGTPSLMSNPQLKRLLAALRENLDITPDAEIKIEIFPKEYEINDLKEKLTILKDFGVTDIVVDLESGNQKSLDYINRKSSSLDKYLNVINACISIGFKNIVSALMVGLPYETIESLDYTIEKLVKIPEVNVINAFPTICRPTDGMALKNFKNPDAYISADERDLQFMYARHKLRQYGFVEGPIAFFHRENKRPDQQTDKFECVNLLGFGISSFGYLNGHNWAAQYYNFCNWNDYLDKIDKGEFAIWRMGVADQEERARRKLIFGLANVKTENLQHIEERFGINVDKVFGQELNALLNLDLINIDASNKGIKFTDAGLMRLEEIGYFLSSKYIKDMCDQLPDSKDPHYRELINQHYYVTIPSFHRSLFERYASTQSKEFMSKIFDTKMQKAG